MNNPIIIAECPEPWLYWWKLLTMDEKIALSEKYCAHSWPFWKGHLLEDEIKAAWEQEKPDPLGDLEWLLLASATVDFPRLPTSAKEAREIWRQVYRIAWDRM